MKRKMPCAVFLCLSLVQSRAWAQGIPAQDSLHIKVTDIPAELPARVQASPDATRERLHVKSFIVPASLFIYGVGSIMNEDLKEVNLAVKEEVYTDNAHKQVHIDNFLQFAPALAVYGLNAVGIKGVHDFKDRSMIYALSTMMVAGSVTTLKYVTHQVRPDLSAYNSFPSGHTAQAFASAEFMRREYSNLSPWYGVAGYAMAAATGYLRMYNNRHWFGDIMAGAGIGIASTDIAYWLYPRLKHRFFPNRKDMTMVIPFHQGGAYGLAMVRKL